MLGRVRGGQPRRWGTRGGGVHPAPPEQVREKRGRRVSPCRRESRRPEPHSREERPGSQEGRDGRENMADPAPASARSAPQRLTSRGKGVSAGKIRGEGSRGQGREGREEGRARGPERRCRVKGRWEQPVPRCSQCQGRLWGWSVSVPAQVWHPLFSPSLRACHAVPS